MRLKPMVLLCAFALILTLIITPPFTVKGDDDSDSFRPGEIVITLRPGANLNEFNARYGTTTLEQLVGTDSYRLGLPPGVDVESFLDAVASDTDLLSAQPNFELQSPEVRQTSHAFIDQTSHAFIDGRSPANFYGQPPSLRVRISEAAARVCAWL
jgi:hypothetical protein